MEKYNREQAIEYAQKWAYKRNPRYYNYDALGGDCTNFISQCIYAGSKVMNYNKIYGWYYNNANDKSPSWTGVEFLYNFLISNTKKGPTAENTSKDKMEIGDIVQLSFDGIKFAHTIIIVGIENDKIYGASHTFDSYYRNLDSYIYKKARFIHIKGILK